MPCSPARPLCPARSRTVFSGRSNPHRDKPPWCSAVWCLAVWRSSVLLLGCSVAWRLMVLDALQHSAAGLVVRPLWSSAILGARPFLCSVAPPFCRSVPHPAAWYSKLCRSATTMSALGLLGVRLSPPMLGYCGAQSLRCSADPALSALGRSLTRRVQRSPALSHSGARPSWRNTLHFWFLFVVCCVD